VAIWGSISLWFIFVLVIGVFPLAYVGVARALFVTENAPSAAFWLGLLLVLVAALLPDFAVRAFLR
jgi:hypothetical protein